MNQVLTVRAIIKHQDKVLLVRRRGGNPQFQGLYELPGGKVDFGEDPKATLQREVFEETGLEVATMQLSDVYSRLDVSDLQKQYVSIVFWVGTPTIERIVLDDEHDKYVWKKLSNVQLNEITDFTRTELQLEASSIKTDDNDKKVTHKDDRSTTNSSRVTIYSDGGSRGNPGPSASGFVIKDSQDRVILEGGKYLGVTTNNQAEYQAVKLALEKALEMNAQYIEFRLDSQLVVNQLNGLYQIKNRDLWPIHAAIKVLIARFKHIAFVHVRREFNTEADGMVNKILDAQG